MTCACQCFTIMRYYPTHSLPTQAAHAGACRKEKETGICGLVLNGQPRQRLHRAAPHPGVLFAMFHGGIALAYGAYLNPRHGRLSESGLSAVGARISPFCFFGMQGSFWAGGPPRGPPAANGNTSRHECANARMRACLSAMQKSRLTATQSQTVASQRQRAAAANKPTGWPQDNPQTPGPPPRWHPGVPFMHALGCCNRK